MSRRTTGNGNGQSGEHHKVEGSGPIAGIAAPDQIARALRKLANAFSAGLSVTIHQAPSAGKIALDCTEIQRATLLQNPNIRLLVDNEGDQLKITRAAPHQKRSRPRSVASELPRKRQPLVVKDVTDKELTHASRHENRSRPRNNTSNKKTHDENGQGDDAGGRPGKKRR
jgi:hypothetical protein